MYVKLAAVMELITGGAGDGIWPCKQNGNSGGPRHSLSEEFEGDEEYRGRPRLSLKHVNEKYNTADGLSTLLLEHMNDKSGLTTSAEGLSKLLLRLLSEKNVMKR